MKTIALKTCFGFGCIMLAILFLALGADASQKQTIRIGVIGPMQFLYGDHQWKAAQMAADEINEAGGIKVNGQPHKVELYKADDNCFISIPDAISAMERLVTRRRVNFVVGGFRTEAVLAQQEIMADNKVIFLGTGSAHDEQNLRVANDYERYKYWFRVGPHASSIQSAAYFAVMWPVIRAVQSELGVEKPRVAILVDQAQWADPIIEMAYDVFEKMGCEVVGEWRPSFTANSVVSELTAIRSAGAHIIFSMQAGPAGSAVARQWGDLQIPAAIAGVNIESLRSTFWEDTNGSCAYLGTQDGINPGVVVTDTTLSYLDKFVTLYGELPAYTANGTYNALYIIKEAVERVGSLDTEALIPALRETDYHSPIGRVAFTPKDHKRPHDLMFGPEYAHPLGIQWVDGKRVAYWPDGEELHQSILDIGAPTGWDKVQHEGIQDYKLPPHMVEYWKNRQ